MAIESKTKPIGWEAPDFSLPATDGGNISSKDFSDKKGLLVAFTCNHCPYAKASWPLLIEFHNKFGSDIGFVGINPNDEATYPEDSFEEMKKRVPEWGISFPYLRDESQEIARAYNAQCTPDIFLFQNDSGKFKLYYHGRINDNWQKPDEVKEKNLEEALSRLTSGQDPPEVQPPSMGCSIKWK